jgi:dihydrofolate reductase
VVAEPTILKVVFSRSLTEATWGDSQIAAADTREEVSRRTVQPGGDIATHGGITFAQSLARLGIVDEYRR